MTKVKMPWLNDGYFSDEGQIVMESFTVPDEFIGVSKYYSEEGSTWALNGLGCKTIIRHIKTISGRTCQMFFENYNEPLTYVLNDTDLCFLMCIGSTPYALYPSNDTPGKVEVRMTLQLREGDDEYLDRKKECVEFVNELIHYLQGGNPT